MHPYKTLTDEQLIKHLNANSQLAFDEIYDRYWKRLFTIAFNKLNDFHVAEEVVQDIFTSLWLRKSELEITTSLASYLAVSVKYRVIREYANREKQRKFEVHILETVSQFDNSTQDSLSFGELKAELNKGIISLPEKCRIVYQLSREQGFSQKEIAEKLNISEKTVESHIGKAIKRLRIQLGYSIKVILVLF